MNRTARTVSVSDPLWTALETMSREMGVDRDVLLNQAIFSLARQFGFITPTQVSLLDGATSAPQPAHVPVQGVSAPAAQPQAVAAPAAQPPAVLAPAVQPQAVPAPAAQPQVARAGDGARSEAAPAVSPLATSEAPAAVKLEESEPSETEAVLAALRPEPEPEPEPETPKVDVEALRPGVVARMRDLIADVDRLVEPVDERLQDDAEDSDGEDTSDEDDSSDDEASQDEDSTGENETSDDSDDEEASGDKEVTDDGSRGASVYDDDDDSPSEGGGLPMPVPKPPAPLETTIVVKTTSGVPLHVKLDEGEPVRVSRERFVIGRGAHCDLVVKSARVSREHAAVVREGAEYFIEDLTSSNGTWFDNTRIARRLVSDGEEYLLGGIRVTFTLG